MPYYRIEYAGYMEGEYASEEEAKQAFADDIKNDELDGYGREWTELITVEDLDANEDGYEWPEDPKARIVACDRCGPVRRCRHFDGRWICRSCYLKLEDLRNESDSTGESWPP